MSLSNNDIDKIFQKAANKAPAPVYSDTYWDEMEAILATESPKRKKGFFWIFSGTIACVALIIFGLNYNSTLDRNVAIIDTNADQEANLIASIDKNNSTKEQITEPIKRIKNPMEPQVFDESFASSDEVESTNVSDENDVQFSKDVVNASSKVEKERKTAQKSTLKVKTPKGRIKPNTMTLAIDDSKNIRKKTTLKTKKKEIELANNDTPRELDNQLFNLELETLPLEALPTQAQSTDLYTRKASLSNKNTFYGIIGAGTSQKLTESQSGMPLTTNIGLGYQINHQSVFARIGLEANASFVPGIEISQRSLVYNFGVNEYSNEYRYTKLLDIDLPIEIGYRANNFNVGLGTKLSYLVGTEMQLSQRVNENIVAEGNYYGQTIGLNRFNASSYVVAETALNNRLSIGGRAGVNWNTRLNGEVTVNEPRTNPIFGNVFLKFNF